MSTCSTEKT